MPKARTAPPADYPTHGLCLCGCGTRTAISDKNIPGANRFVGYPRLYVHGHNGRGKKRNLPRRARYVATNGYVFVLAPDHPAATEKGYVLEHRLVMEKVLGRRLETWEHVHHVDQDKQNNADGNLRVMTKRDHLRHHADDPAWLAKLLGGKRTPMPPDRRKQVSERMKALWASGRFVGQTRSAATRQKLAEATRRAWVEGRHARRRSDDTRRKMSESAKRWRRERREARGSVQG